MVHRDPQWSLRDNESSDWQIRGEISPRWIRVKFGDTYVGNSKRVLVVTETGKLPVYYFPLEDVRSELLIRSIHTEVDPHKGEAQYWHVDIGDRIIENAAWSYASPIAESTLLDGYISFVWRKADAWYEEEEEVFVHTRDPYTRVDAIPSSRHIKIIVGGKVVAESRNAVVLFETGLTPRYYLPPTDIRFEYLIPSDTVTRCPYKGIASYHSVVVAGKRYDDVVWSYAKPLPEVHEIAERYSFYNEQVDAVYIDGERWELQSGDRLPYKKIKD
ncbi:DUF427 domain-containing protein [Paenibacillus favisporus]|uniref:DUF427 domain-containing protein n=1 Tax=Paenibacillus favisporus TaxID=221028 RepID=UPI0013D588D5|nr:DUF427 domain-containing protein [Paenibacillus favisporus]